MSSFPDSRIDFAEVKRQCSGQCRQVIEAVTGVKLPASNGPCPKCGEGDDRFFLHKDFDQSGGVGLRNGECGCPGPEGADIIGTVGWLCSIDSLEAARRISEHLGLSEPRRNGKSVAQKPPVASLQQPTTAGRDLEKPGPEPKWKKPGIDQEAVVAAGGQAIQHRGESCVEFAVTCDGQDGPISGYYFARLDGKLFAGGKKSVNLTAAGSQSCNGWLVAGRGPGGGYVCRSEAIQQCHTIWRVEGPPDLVALLSRLPAGHAVVSGISPSGDNNLSMDLFAGKTVYGISDNDGAGRSQVNAFSSKAVEVAKSVTIVDFNRGDDRLASGFDVRDFFIDGGDFDGLMTVARENGKSVFAEPVDALTLTEPTQALGKPELCQRRQFPVDELPEPVAGFIRAGSAAIGCDPSFVALPLLTVLGASIGNSRGVQMKRGWIVPPILWIAVVGESGSSKTPSFKLVMRPLRDRQRKALKAHSESMKEYEVELARYEKELAVWKRDRKTNDPPPDKPEPPAAQRYIVSDVTVEALAPLLLENQRGLLLARDELAGWLGSFDRYSGGKGADAAHWLSMFNGESIVVDRKGGNPRTIYVPRASVSVCGGIQPGILHRALGSEHRESGLAARLLLTCPPRKAKRWTEADVDPAVEEQLARLVDRLFELQPAIDDDGNLRPVVLGLTPDAKAAWKRFYNRHAEEHADLSGELSAAWAKLEETAARLALIIHCVRWAANDPTLECPDAVDSASMNAGIELTEWFKDEARRVYSLLAESDNDREDRELVELIQRKGGSVTPRDLMRSSRKWATADEAEAALNQLAAVGYGQWTEQPTSTKGGRPTRVFVLVDSVDVDTTPLNPAKNDGSVGVNRVEGPETPDWGEL